MTADRWWVRMGARWIARVDSVKAHLNLFFTAMTGVSVASGALAYLGLRRFVAPFVGLTAVGVLAYSYLYAEGGVWNQVQRDRRDLSTNWAGPTARINAEMTSRTWTAAQQGEALSEAQRRAAKREADAAFEEFRDGYELEKRDRDAERERRAVGDDD
jgi:hypothetical protein